MSAQHLPWGPFIHIYHQHGQGQGSLFLFLKKYLITMKALVLYLEVQVSCSKHVFLWLSPLHKYVSVLHKWNHTWFGVFCLFVSSFWLALSELSIIPRHLRARQENSEGEWLAPCPKH